MRWQQFDALVAGGAAMPEPGFAWALYYRVAGRRGWEESGRLGVERVTQNTAQDLRQLALVFDCAGH